MPRNYAAKKVYTQSSVFDSKAEYRVHQEFEGLTHHPKDKVEYVIHHTYTADYLTPTGHLLEVKGYLAPEDRAKYIAIKRCHPEVNIVFLFTKPNETISKASRTTYGEWAKKCGFEWYTLETFPPEKYGCVRKVYERKVV